MNVGIITLPPKNNFGGLLQAIALQRAIRKLGGRATTMYWVNSERDTRETTYLYWRRRYFTWLAYHVCAKWIAKLTKADNYRFTGFMHRHLHQQVCRFPLTSKQMGRLNINKWIVGGDQVFRHCYMPHQETMALSFLTQEQRRSAFTYSASFGSDEWEWPKETTEECRPLLADFKAVSVREESGAQLVRQYLGRDACVMPDPAMLLTDEEYDALMAEDNSPLPDTYAAYYILDETPEIKKWIDDFCSAHHSPAVDMQTDHQAFVGPGRNKFNVRHSPAFWLKSLKHARYLITDSFHGVLYALLFRIPFICFGNKERGNARFDMLDSVFHIRNRIVTPHAPLLIEDFTDEENQYFAQKRQELREEGLRFIAENLGISPS